MEKYRLGAVSPIERVLVIVLVIVLEIRNRARYS